MSKEPERHLTGAGVPPLSLRHICLRQVASTLVARADSCDAEITTATPTLPPEIRQDLFQLLVQWQVLTDAACTALHCADFLPSANNLSLAGCSLLSASALLTHLCTHALPWLVSLSMPGVQCLSDALLSSILSVCPNLSRLELSSCLQLTDAAVLAIAGAHPGSDWGCLGVRQLADVHHPAEAQPGVLLGTQPLSQVAKGGEEHPMNSTGVHRQPSPLPPLATAFAAPEGSGPHAGHAAASDGCAGTMRPAADAHAVHRMRSLSALSLSGCWQIGRVSPLARCSHLVSLTLDGCWQVRDAELRQLLSLLPLMESLSVSGCFQIGSAFMVGPPSSQSPSGKSPDPRHEHAGAEARSPGTFSGIPAEGVLLHRLRSLDVSGTAVQSDLLYWVAMHCCQRLQRLAVSDAPAIDGLAVAAVLTSKRLLHHHHHNNNNNSNLHKHHNHNHFAAHHPSSMGHFTASGTPAEQDLECHAVRGGTSSVLPLLALNLAGLSQWAPGEEELGQGGGVAEWWQQQQEEYERCHGQLCIHPDPSYHAPIPWPRLSGGIPAAPRHAAQQAQQAQHARSLPQAHTLLHPPPPPPTWPPESAAEVLLCLGVPCLGQIQELDLGRCRGQVPHTGVGAQVAEFIGQHCRGLRRLSLSQCPVGDAELEDIALLPHLTHLDVSGCTGSRGAAPGSRFLKHGAKRRRQGGVSDALIQRLALRCAATWAADPAPGTSSGPAAMAGGSWGGQGEAKDQPRGGAPPAQEGWGGWQQPRSSGDASPSSSQVSTARCAVPQREREGQQASQQPSTDTHATGVSGPGASKAHPRSPPSPLPGLSLSLEQPGGCAVAARSVHQGEGALPLCPPTVPPLQSLNAGGLPLRDPPLGGLAGLASLQLRGCRRVCDPGLLLCLLRCPDLRRLELGGCAQLTAAALGCSLVAGWVRPDPPMCPGGEGQGGVTPGSSQGALGAGGGRGREGAHEGMGMGMALPSGQQEGTFRPWGPTTAFPPVASSLAHVIPRRVSLPRHCCRVEVLAWLAGRAHHPHQTPSMSPLQPRHTWGGVQTPLDRGLGTPQGVSPLRKLELHCGDWGGEGSWEGGRMEGVGGRTGVLWEGRGGMHEEGVLGGVEASVPRVPVQQPGRYLGKLLRSCPLLTSLTLLAACGVPRHCFNDLAASCRLLSRLSVTGCGCIGDAELAALGALPALRHLSLVDCAGVADAGLEEFARAAVASAPACSASAPADSTKFLRGASVEGEPGEGGDAAASGPAVPPGAPAPSSSQGGEREQGRGGGKGPCVLQSLRLEGCCGVGDGGVIALVHAAPHLSVLTLRRLGRVGDAGATAALARCANLQQLSLGGSGVSGGFLGNLVSEQGGHAAAGVPQPVSGEVGGNMGGVTAAEAACAVGGGGRVEVVCMGLRRLELPKQLRLKPGVREGVEGLRSRCPHLGPPRFV